MKHVGAWNPRLLAQQLGVNKTTVERAASGRSWRHLNKAASQIALIKD